MVLEINRGGVVLGVSWEYMSEKQATVPFFGWSHEHQLNHHPGTLGDAFVILHFIFTG